MAISDEFLEHILDQLKGVGTVRAKRMFGGAGLYLDHAMFALIADDVLYFKVHESNRRDYEALGMAPFSPFGRAMPYFEVPADVLEDREELRDWALKSVAIASSTPLPKTS